MSEERSEETRAEEQQEQQPAEQPKKRKKKFGPGKIVAVALSGALIVAISIWLMVAFLRPQVRNKVADGYGSAVIVVKEGEKFTASAFTSTLKERDEEGNAVSGDEDTYDAVDVFGRLNWTFAQKTNWQAAVRGTVETAVGPQDVQTYKNYANGMLICADITTSGMVNVARQFCYIPGQDRVLWRESTANKSEWNGMDTPFPDSAPLGNMTISGENGFRNNNGLPATELSVYVIEGDTVKEAKLVDGNASLAANGDGTFSIYYDLIPSIEGTDGHAEGAAAYYGNQMVFTGGIDAPPTFSYIHVTYTFNENWEPLVCEVEENYHASMKTINTTCTYTSRTEYAYDVEGLEEQVNEVYESNYKEYAQKDATGQQQRPVTATDCLASAFGVLLSKPSTLRLEADIAGTKTDGTVYVKLADGDSMGGLLGGGETSDILNTMEARVKLGDVISLWLDGGTVYVQYGGGVKASVSLGEIMALVNSPAPAAETEEKEETEGTEKSASDLLLEQLFGGEFHATETSASLLSTIELGGIQITLDFAFAIKDRNASLDVAKVSLEIGDVPVTAEIRFADNETAPAALSEEEKSEFAGLDESVSYLYGLAASEVLKAEVGYTNEETGISVSGTVSLAPASMQLDGDLTVGYRGAEKNVHLGFTDGRAYLNADGVKVEAGLADVLALVNKLTGGLSGEQSEFDIGALIENLLSDRFASLLQTAKEGDLFALTVKGTELLSAFGVEFELGEVKLTLGAEGIGLHALGISLGLAKGTAFTVDTDGFADVMPYADGIVSLVKAEAFAADVNYSDDDLGLTLEGSVKLMSDLSAAQGSLTAVLGGKEKNIDALYTEGVLYLTVDGVKVKADLGEVIALFGNEPQPAAISLAEADENDVIGRLLSLTFGEVVSVAAGEETLTVTVDADSVLGALGTDVKIGQIVLLLNKAGALSMTAAGARLDAQTCDPFTVTVTEEEAGRYAELTPYVGTLKGLFEGGFVHAELSYEAEDKTLSVSGGLDVDLSSATARADLTLCYGEAVKPLTVIYKDHELYLDLDGVKVSADVTEAVALVEAFLGFADPSEPDAPAAARAAAAEEDGTLRDMLTALFGLDFGDLLTVEENGSSLLLTLKGSDLLGALGIEFALGDVTVKVTDTAIEASALGVNFSVTAGGPFDAMTEDYLDVTPYLSHLLALFEKDGIALSLGYERDGLTIDGEALVSFAGQAQATLALGYEGLEKSVGILWPGDGFVYLKIDELLIKCDVAEAVSLIASLIGGDVSAPELPAPEPLPEGVNEYLERLLSADLTSLVQLSGEDGALKVLLTADELLKAFGLDFSLGAVTVTLDGNGLKAEANGLTLTACGSDETVDAGTDGYTDFTPAVAEAVRIIAERQLSLSGSISVTANGSVYEILVDEGVLSWADGVNAYLSLRIAVGESVHDVILSVTPSLIRAVYGNVGIELRLDEIDTLTEALDALRARLKEELVDPILGRSEEQEPAPAAADPEEPQEGDAQSVLDQLLAYIRASGLLDRLGEFDFASLNGLKLKNSSLENGIASVSFEGFTLDLVAGGSLGAVLSYRGDVNADGTLTLAAHTGELPEAPADIDYLSTEEYTELLDLLGAAAGLVAQENVHVDIEGTVYSEAEQYVTEDDQNGVRYNVSGGIDYFSGGGFPVVLREDGVLVNSTLYLHLALNVAARLETDDSVYIDVYFFDPELDGVLDIYVNASAFPKEDGRYNPVSFHAPMDEIMTVLSGVCSMFGVDSGVLDSVLVSRWLSLAERAQMRALGNSLLEMLGNMVGVDVGGILSAVQSAFDGVGSILGGSEPRPQTVALDAEETRRGILKSIACGENAFELVFDGGQLYGAAYEGQDLTVRFEKRTDGETGRSLLSAVTFGNVIRAGERTDFGVKIGTDPVTFDRNDIPTFDYNFVGFERFLIALAKSATHPADGTAQDEVISGEETVHEYVLNNNFYISGKITIAVPIVSDIEVRLIAVSVTIDEDGKVGINIRLEYDGMSLAIKGDSEVDVTIKDGMVYMKRVQKTEFRSLREVDLVPPYTLYRVTTLGNFMGDILDHMIFLFNFTDTIVDLIKNNSGGGSTEPAPAEKEDYGAQLTKYLKAYLYSKAEDGSESWNITINGDAIASGVLGDLAFTLKTDADGYLRNIGVKATVVSVITATAELTWRNPGGIMEGGVTDATNDIQAQLERDMAQILADADWTQKTYYEGEYTTVTFRAGDSVLGTQDVVRDPSDGTLYTELNYPALDGVKAPDGQSYVWEEVTKVDRNSYIDAKAVANVYRLVFRSAEEVTGEGWSKNGDVWEYVVERYSYGSELALPFFKTNAREIVSFSDRDGHAFTSILDKWYIFEDEIVFTANWEYIDYTVTYDVDGKLERQTAHYGDALGFPAHEKTGYTFTGWLCEGETVGEDGTVTGDMYITAQFEAQTFEITLVSDYAIESDAFTFTLQTEGTYANKYVATFTFTYDTAVTLPSELRTEQNGVRYFLDGFTYDGAEGFVTVMPNVLADTVFTAQWTEAGTYVRFYAGEDLVATRNYAVGAALKDAALPEVPARQGYSGAWDIEDGFTVEATEEGYDVRAIYTPLEYYFTVFSAREVTGEGWSKHEPTESNPATFWQRTFTYTYDGTPVEDIGTGVKTAGFDFDGFWSGSYGAGGVVYDRQWTRIDNETVERFDFNVGNAGGANQGLEGRNILYARWCDNTVTAKLYSEFSFEGEEGSDANGHYRTISRNDGNYNVDVTLTANGYLHMGWFYLNAEGNYEAVTSLQRFYEKDGENSVTLYALWVRTVEITVERLSQTDSILSKSISIGGTVAGGDVPSGSRSADIVQKTNAAKSMQVRYIIFDAGGSKDALNSGRFDALSGNEFGGSGTSFNASVWSGGATYGGVELQLTYTVGGQELMRTFSKAVTFAEHTLEYQTEGGQSLHKVTLRLDCPYAYDAGDILLASTVDTRTYAEQNGIEVPAKEGHTAAWPSRPVTGSMVVTPEYVVEMYDVLFVSDVEIDGFEDGAAFGYDGKWVLDTRLEYGARVSFFDMAGDELDGSLTVTVPAFLGDKGEYDRIIITVPAVPPVGAKAGHWEPDIRTDGAMFTSVYDLDKVVYHSAVAFDGLSTAGSLTVQYTEEYTLIAPEAQGYTFLGWFTEADGAWQKAPATLQVSMDAPVTYEVEALWVSDATLGVNVSRSSETEGVLWNKKTYYKHNIAANLSGGKLIGAPADGITASLAYSFVVNDSENAEENPWKTKQETVDSYRETYNWESERGGQNETHSWGHAKVTITYSFGGETLWTKTLEGHKAY